MEIFGTAILAILFVLGGCVLGAVVAEKGLPWIVGLLLGKEYRQERASRDAEAEARGRAFKERERQEHEAEEKEEAEALERAREMNRRQRAHVRRLDEEMGDNRNEAVKGRK